MVKGDKWHFTIKNYTGKQYMWDNLVLFVTTDADRGRCTEHLAFRQDRETGGNGNYWGACEDNGTVTVTDNYLEKGYQESNFLNEMDGATIDITVTYDEDGTYTIDEDITLASGNKYQRKAVCTGINNVVRLFFTVERSHIEIQEAERVQSKYIGSMDKDNAWWRCHSDLYTLQAGKTAHLKFKTHAGENDNYKNWNLIAYNGVGHPLTQGDGYQEYFVVRNDQYTLTGGSNVSFRNAVTYYDKGEKKNLDWATYRQDCQDADVDMYITFSGGKINVNAWTTKGDHVYTYGFTYTANIDAETITYAFTPDHAYMSDFKILADNLTAIGAADCSSEWTEGYNEATATQKHTLQDGDSYRYKFINVNRTDNKIWNNTMVRAFNGNDELKVSLRFDNYEDITGNADRIRMSDRNSLEDIHAAVIDLVATYKSGKLYISERILATNGTTEHYYQFQKTTSGNTICLQTHSNYFILLEEGVPTEEQINNVYELPYKAKAESYYSSHDALDEAGKAAYDAACTKTTYPMLYDDVDNDVRANYITGVKAQTTPKSDMTKAVVNAAGNESCGWDVPVNGWTAETTISRDFHGNNWSTEDDGTGMSKPFLEYWQGKGNNLRDANIKHDAISGLHAGWYRVSALIRAFNEDSNELPTGFSLYANDAVSTTEGTEGTYGSSKIVYGTYTVDVYLNGEEDLIFGVKVENANFNWIAFKNFKLTYMGIHPLTDSRTTLQGKYGTICLPYNAETTNAEVYTAEVNGNVVELTEAPNGIEAGVPYVFKATADAPSFSYTAGTIVNEPKNEGVLKGSFEQITVPVGAYVLQTQNDVQSFYKVYEGHQPTMKAYRAYLETSGTNARELTFGTDETAIEALNALINGDAKIYDLNGRQLQHLQKGVNIVNGKKFIVK